MPWESVSLSDDIVREGARRMPAAALEAEVDAYLAELAGERDERGWRLAAQDRWRAVNAPHLVALVRAGATFIDGQLIERPADAA
jgi:hypothetical protein